MELKQELSLEELEDVAGGGFDDIKWRQCNVCGINTPDHVLDRYGGKCRSCNSKAAQSP